MSLFPLKVYLEFLRGGPPSKIEDADKDTVLEVERTPDGDEIHGKCAGADTLNIDSLGIVTLPKQSGFYAYRTAAQVIPDQTWRNIVFDTISYDTQNEYDTVLGTFTPTKIGKYPFQAQAMFNAGVVADCRISLRLMWFMSVMLAYNVIHTSHAGEITVPLLVPWLHIGGFYNIQVWHNFGGNVNLVTGIGNTWFSCNRMA